MEINLREFRHSVFAFDICSWETRLPQPGEHYRVADHYRPALLAELPVTLATQPVPFRQETTHIPGDLSKIKSPQNPCHVSTPSKTVFTFFFQTTLGAKHRLTDLFRRPLDDLKAAFMFTVPMALHSCNDDPLRCSSATAFLYLSFAAGNSLRFQTAPVSPPTHPTETGGAGGRRTEVP